MASPSPPSSRISQRRPLACTECTRIKKRCDKLIPCSRCSRNGLACSREIVRVRKDVTKNQNEVTYLKKLRDQLVLENFDVTSQSFISIIQRIVLLEHGIEGSGDIQTSGVRIPNFHPGDDPHASQASDMERGTKTQSMVSGELRELQTFPEVIAQSQSDFPAQQMRTERNAEAETGTMITILENLGWGRHYGSCYPHAACTCRTHRSKSEITSISSRTIYEATDWVTPNLRDPSILPPPDVARKLVQFHITYVAWHHNALHSPTFLDQCERYWYTRQCPQGLWMALYFSVISTSVWCAQNSARFRATLNIEFYPSMARTLFRGMVDVLYSEEFLENLSIYSIQAILISTEVAHNLGYSAFNATLTSAAARIAQCLGLHKIQDQPSLAAGATDYWYEMVEREIGKRVWCIFLIQDYFAIPFTDSSCINPSQFSTSLPSNCDDYDLDPKDPDRATISSYTITLARMAGLIPLLVEKLGPLGKRKPQQEQYKSVIEVDHQMRDLIGQIPSFLLHESPLKPDETPWLDIARRSLAITAADKIIMIHRPFLFQSFENPSYTYTRNTCVAAARTILREHEKISNADDISIWTHSAFCVTALIVLGLEILYQRQGDPEMTRSTRELILSARERLGKRQDDVMAERAANLIETILHAEQQMRSQDLRDPQPIQESHWDGQRTTLKLPVDFRTVLKEFVALDHAASFNVEKGGAALEMQNLLLPMDDDFDFWFTQTFKDLS